MGGGDGAHPGGELGRGGQGGEQHFFVAPPLLLVAQGTHRGEGGSVEGLGAFARQQGAAVASPQIGDGLHQMALLGQIAEQHAGRLPRVARKVAKAERPSGVGGNSPAAVRRPGFQGVDRQALGVEGEDAAAAHALIPVMTS